MCGIFALIEQNKVNINPEKADEVFKSYKSIIASVYSELDHRGPDSKGNNLIIDPNFKKTVLDHYLKIESDYILEVNSKLIPTTKLDNVSSTPFDFRQLKLIGQHITSDDNQLRLGSGYDHCWVLNGEGDLQSVCKIVHKDTGRLLEVFTTEPGIQIYTGNHLEGIYNKHSGVCLETQHFPNSPLEPKLPTLI